MAMHSGKPAYDLTLLRHMTIGELRERIGRISNQQARHIAVGLWQELAGCWRGMDARQLRDGATVVQALGWRPQALVELVNVLRGMDFGQVIMEGPEGMDEFLERLHPLWRIFMPPPRLRRSFDNAKRLSRFLEFYVNPDRSMPAGVLNWLKLIGGLLVGLAMLYGGMLYLKTQHQPPPWKLALAGLPAIIVIIAAGREFQAYFRRRVLAIYISFTDEFMDDEKQYDGRLPRGPGW